MCIRDRLERAALRGFERVEEPVAGLSPPGRDTRVEHELPYLRGHPAGSKLVVGSRERALLARPGRRRYPQRAARDRLLRRAVSLARAHDRREEPESRRQGHQGEPGRERGAANHSRNFLELRARPGQIASHFDVELARLRNQRADHKRVCALLLALDEQIATGDLHGVLIRGDADLVIEAHATSRCHHVALDATGALELVTKGPTRPDCPGGLELPRSGTPRHRPRTACTSWRRVRRPLGSAWVVSLSLIHISEPTRPY